MLVALLDKLCDCLSQVASAVLAKTRRLVEDNLKKANRLSVMDREPIAAWLTHSKVKGLRHADKRCLVSRQSTLHTTSHTLMR